MDCHRCEHLRYDGTSYGRCGHHGHHDVVFNREDARRRSKSGERVYNTQICPDFQLRRRCPNCRHWERGRYFADGRTPAAKGRCSLGILRSALECPKWTPGLPRRKGKLQAGGCRHGSESKKER